MSSSSADNTKEYGIGLGLSLLIRSHIYRSIYLVSEYRFSGYYKWNTDDYNSYNYNKYDYLSQPTYYANQNHTESTGWKFEFSTIKVGLLIDF